MFRIVAITATLLGVASAAHADVYRWTDAKGTVQYSDKWVPGSTLVKSSGNHTPPPSNSAPEASSTPSGSEPVDAAQSERDKRQVQADMAKNRAEQCKKAQDNYEKAITVRRIYKTDEKGERIYVSDAEADAYRLELLSARKQACGS